MGAEDLPKRPLKPFIRLIRANLAGGFDEPLPLGLFIWFWVFWRALDNLMSNLEWQVDIEELKSLLSAEFERDPLLLNEVGQLLADGRLSELGAVFDYLFTVTTARQLGQ